VKEPAMSCAEELLPQVVGNSAQSLYEVCLVAASTVLVGVLVSMIREQALEISRESRPAKIWGVATARLSTAAEDTASGVTTDAAELVVLTARELGEGAGESADVP
jgi:hypothetical protein